MTNNTNPSELVEAAKALRDDLLMRAEKDDDGTLIVNASFGRWRRFCNALDGLSRPTDTQGVVERAVMVCPQCEGEGGYPDGVDEAACHIDCTRCGGNGWIVDLAALSSIPNAVEKDTGQ